MELAADVENDCHNLVLHPFTVRWFYGHPGADVEYDCHDLVLHPFTVRWFYGRPAAGDGIAVLSREISRGQVRNKQKQQQQNE